MDKGQSSHVQNSAPARLPHKMHFGRPNGLKQIAEKAKKYQKILGPTFDFIVYFVCVCVGEVDCI